MKNSQDYNIGLDSRNDGLIADAIEPRQHVPLSGRLSNGHNTVRFFFV